ncbi:TraR/DksA family transcriptional regulator [Amnibacterium flavum]|uniref:Molecular chaperone DnaK n=1 Tax=Amnibacterium flavum TaxID=2173173 RepID=A0A2V1HNI8_9MICO|nr:TraR/DksA C4-type zinc finger protein [Amnibacterium flavum]PVZ94156.1 molecular chaperone DnaK [Amnibacterium flavum]
MDATTLRAALTEAAIGTEQLLRSLGADIASIVDARRDTSTDDEHDPEGSTLAYERSQADALRAGALARLDDIQLAFQRVDRGDFGRCEVCGRPIPDERLELRPWTNRCVDHA